MKKKIIIIIIAFVLLSSILGILSYLWILKPISFQAEEVHTRLTDITYDFLTLEKTDELNLQAFDGKLPSDKYEDYRSVLLIFQMDYRSAFYMEDFQAAVKSIDTENRKYVLRTGTSGFQEGETTPGNFLKRTVSGLNMDIYVGDLKNQEEIRERILDIARHTKIKILYHMQWIGNRETEFIFPEDFTAYSFCNMMTGETYEQFGF